MRLWVDVYDTDGVTRLGEGPILTATYASVRRALDGQGSIEFSFPATDLRALDLVQNERRVRIWVDHDHDKRELGRGIIRKSNYETTESGQQFKVTGPDTLNELTRRIVGRNRQYENQTVATVADSLLSLVSGWDAVVEDGLGSVSARFSGANVLKALIRLAEEKGCHIREGEAYRSLEIGVFGSQQSGADSVQILGTSNATRDLHHNDNLIVIDRLSVTYDSEAVVNRIYPLGAGEGEAALTLKNSTSSSPYAIEQVSISGQVEYYLEDADSVALYGVIENYAQFKEIGPLSNTETSKIYAANMLYTAAAAWLQRQAVIHTAYQVTGKKPRRTVRPGDKIRMRYTGSVWKDNTEVRPVDINDWFWVMSVTENISDSGLTIGLELSTIDLRAPDFAEDVVGAIEAIQVRGVAVQTYPFWSENTYYELTSAISTETTHPATYDETLEDAFYGQPNSPKAARFKLEIDDSVTDITKVQIRFRTFPLYLTVFHQIIGGLHYGWWGTAQASHYPRHVGLYINGTHVSAQFGGPWDEGEDGQVEVTLDITDLIVNATGGMYQNHRIIIGCLQELGDPASPDTSETGLNTNLSHGFIEMNIRVIGSAQSILPS